MPVKTMMMSIKKHYHTMNQSTRGTKQHSKHRAASIEQRDSIKGAQWENGEISECMHTHTCRYQFILELK